MNNTECAIEWMHCKEFYGILIDFYIQDTIQDDVVIVHGEYLTEEISLDALIKWLAPYGSYDTGALISRVTCNSDTYFKLSQFYLFNVKSSGIEYENRLISTP